MTSDQLCFEQLSVGGERPLVWSAVPVCVINVKDGNGYAILTQFVYIITVQSDLLDLIWMLLKSANCYFGSGHYCVGDCKYYQNKNNYDLFRMKI